MHILLKAYNILFFSIIQCAKSLSFNIKIFQKIKITTIPVTENFFF